MNFRQALARSALLAALLATAGAGMGERPGRLPAASRAALSKAIANPLRSPANVARDKYRHPAETLAFFGVDPGDSVVEIWPGGGWYTEILAPYLARGTYYAAGSERALTGARALSGTHPDIYGRTRFAAFPAAADAARVPDGSVDVVLTFRNVHNWMMAGSPFAQEAFRQMYAMLKPGGTLGVVDHRLPESQDAARERSSGYVKTSTVRGLAEQAGFRFAGSSEINANPKDKADYPNGVWTLPPTLRNGDVDRDRYLAIGESDRMTLRFVKPK
jgi:predicted methyltransferase